MGRANLHLLGKFRGGETHTIEIVKEYDFSDNVNEITLPENYTRFIFLELIHRDLINNNTVIIPRTFPVVALQEIDSNSRRIGSSQGIQFTFNKTSRILTCQSPTAQEDDANLIIYCALIDLL